MSTAEYVFAVIGIIIVIGGFVYGIYDSYYQHKDLDKTDKPKDSSAG